MVYTLRDIPKFFTLNVPKTKLNRVVKFSIILDRTFVAVIVHPNHFQELRCDTVNTIDLRQTNEHLQIEDRPVLTFSTR